MVRARGAHGEGKKGLPALLSSADARTSGRQVYNVEGHMAFVGVLEYTLDRAAVPARESDAVERDGTPVLGCRSCRKCRSYGRNKNNRS